MRFVVIAAITCDDRKPVVNGRRGYEKVRLGERVARFSAFLDQKSPLQDDVFGDLETAAQTWDAPCACDDENAPDDAQHAKQKADQPNDQFNRAIQVLKGQATKA
jgi:hypothetical protein